MRLGIKLLILVISAVLITSGVFAANTVLENFLTPEPASSIVYIENGVSGVVTITDPYLNKTRDIHIDYYSLGTGSGVIMTNDGYIITAFHVIGDPKTLNNQKMLKKMEDDDIKQYLEQVAVADYIKNGNPQFGSKITNNVTFNTNYSSNVDFITDQLAQNNLLNVKAYKQVIKVKFPPDGPFSISKSMDARIIDVGNSSIQEDVALLKVDNVDNLPALDISSSDPIKGEKIWIYGYPGNSGTQYKVSIEPTTSSGIVITKLFNNLGTVYYQTNAHTAAGFSGGPVLNSQNEILGIAIYEIQTYGRLRRDIQSEYSLYLSSEYLIEICKKNNVPITIRN